LKFDRSEQYDLAPGMPELTEELVDDWQQKTRNFIELVRTYQAESERD